jgi:hypothetical protein
MTQLGFMAFAFVADAGEADSDCFGFFLMIRAFAPTSRALVLDFETCNAAEPNGLRHC